MHAPPPSRQPVRAATLRRGARARVAAVEGRGAVVERLAAVGLVPGATFVVVRGGCPMAVAMGASRFGLGREWAEALLVLPR